MNEVLPENEERATEDENAFIYLNTEAIKELCLMPWADFKSKFGFYLNLALLNGEVYVLCMRSLFKEKGAPASFSKFAEGMDRTHYYHQMPMDLVRLLNGTQVKLVFQSAKSIEMLYNMTRFCPNGSDDLIGHYRHEPEGHTCCSWMTVDEVAVCTYLDQFMLEDPIMKLLDLEQFHFSKTKMSTFLSEGKMSSQCQYSMFWKKHKSMTEKQTKVSKTTLWTSLSDPPANIIQICGCSVEVVQFNLHGFFLQYELGDHSQEQVAQMKFAQQVHPDETQAEMRDRYQGYRVARLEDALEMQAMG